MRQKTMIIPNGSLGKIYGILSLPEKEGRCPLIILSHGFGSDHEANQDYAEAFTEQGFGTFNFDFCGGGRNSMSVGTMEQMTVLTEAKDLMCLVQTLYAEPYVSAVYLWGESQGGFVSAYVAAKQPDLVEKLVLLYPAFVLQSDAEKRRLADGSFPEQTPFGDSFVTRKYNEDAVSFDIYEIIARYRKPVLILHGDQDDVVPPEWSEKAAAVYERATLTMIPGGGHGFESTDRDQATKEAVAFFRKRRR